MSRRIVHFLHLVSQNPNGANDILSFSGAKSDGRKTRLLPNGSRSEGIASGKVGTVPMSDEKQARLRKLFPKP